MLRVRILEGAQKREYCFFQKNAPQITTIEEWYPSSSFQGCVIAYTLPIQPARTQNMSYDQDDYQYISPSPDGRSTQNVFITGSTQRNIGAASFVLAIAFGSVFYAFYLILRIFFTKDQLSTFGSILLKIFIFIIKVIFAALGFSIIIFVIYYALTAK